MLKIFKANHIVKLFKAFEKVKSHITALISEKSQENWENMLVSWPLLNDFANAQKIFCKSLSNIWELISFQLVQAWDDLIDQNFGIENNSEVR